MHEDLTIQNHSDQPQRVTVDVEYGSDFADLFEVKDHAHRRGQIRAEVTTDHLRLIYSRDDFRRETIISFDERFTVGPERARTEVTLEPRGQWRTCIDVAPVGTGEMYRLRHGERAFGNPKPDMPTSFEQWMAQAPTLITDNDVLLHTYGRSLVDLAALRFRPLKTLSYTTLASGRLAWPVMSGTTLNWPAGWNATRRPCVSASIAISGSNRSAATRSRSTARNGRSTR